MNAQRLYSLVVDKVGEGVALSLAGPDEVFHALQAAQVELAKMSLATRIQVVLDVPVSRRIPLSATHVNLIALDLPMHLFQTSFTDVIERTPDWASTQDPAQHWFQITPRIIGVDGVVAGGKVTISVLEEPTPIVDASSTVDDRLRQVDENALVLLAAATLLQNAADGQDLNRAAALRKEGFKLAVQGRPQ